MELVNRVENEFSKHANEYNNYNIIQQIVSKALVRELMFEPKRILELGCGSGQVFKNINFDVEYYKAIDFSQNMCDIHPKSTNLDIICLNFDTKAFHDNLKNEKYDIVLSSSALQWSKDLGKIITTLSKVSSQISMVLFTANTFKTIFQLSNKTSPILTLEEIQQAFDKTYKCSYEVINYKLEFENKKKLFDYIKNSGVGAAKKLSYKEAKNLYKNYTLNYLEFEVVFIKGKKC